MNKERLMIKFFLSYVLIVLTTSSCLSPKKDPLKFLYRYNDSSVQLKILSGNDFLFFDTPTRVDFLWTNIDPRTGSIYGAGIKIIETKNNITKTEIDVPSNYLHGDTLNIKLSFKVSGQTINTDFSVPLKIR